MTSDIKEAPSMRDGDGIEYELERVEDDSRETGAPNDNKEEAFTVQSILAVVVSIVRNGLMNVNEANAVDSGDYQCVPRLPLYAGDAQCHPRVHQCRFGTESKLHMDCSQVMLSLLLGMLLV